MPETSKKIFIPPGGGEGKGGAGKGGQLGGKMSEKSISSIFDFRKKFFLTKSAY